MPDHKIIKSPYPPLPPLPECNVHDFCFNRPDQKEWPEDYTLHIDAVSGKRRTFTEFKARMRDLMTALGGPVSEGGLGLNAGQDEIIGILSENCSDYIVLMHALLSITTPFTLLSSYSTPFELAHTAKLAQCTRIFAAPRLLPRALRVASDLGIPHSKVYVMNGRARGRTSLSGMVARVRRAKAKGGKGVDVRPAKRDTLAYLVSSSGTTGLPKAVMITHGNLVCSMAQGLMTAALARQVYTPPPIPTKEGIPVALSFLPLHHTYGLHSCNFRAFYAPTTYVIMPRWDVETALKLIPKYHVTTLSLIPSVVHQLANSPQTAKTDLSSILAWGSGAAYLPQALAEKFERHVPRAISTEGYGQSEGTIAAIVRPFPGVLGLQPKPGSTGMLLPDMEARLVRDDGTDDGREGELWLRSASIAPGYWNNPKANKETFVDGWLRTGDRFRVEEDGTFYFEDRAKDTLKISGAQVSPSEIEVCLLAHPDKLIVDATVAGVSGGRTADEKIPRAWVVLSRAGRARGRAEVVRALETWVEQNLSKYKWLRGGVEVVMEIPKSPTGKVLRRVLVDEYEKRAKAKAKL